MRHFLGLCLVAAMVLFVGSASAMQSARSVGVGQGVLSVGEDRNPCPGSYLIENADGSFENGYAWQYGAVVPPYYGAFAEGYDFAGSLCGIHAKLTTLPDHYSGQQADWYVWGSDGWMPTNVISITPGVAPGQPGIWPIISAHDIDVVDTRVDRFFVGYWGAWPGGPTGWFVAADIDGSTVKQPRTNIAPGIGYPTGWQDPSVVWGRTAALGIGAYVRVGPGACCRFNGACHYLWSDECASLGGTFLGDGTSCDPNPCPQPAGACCFYYYSMCVVMTEDDCAEYGGTFQGIDTLCEPNPCDASSVDGSSLPVSHRIHASPNPSSAEVSITWDLPTASTMTLEVFDTSGARVRQLAYGPRPAGQHAVRWDGRDDSGREVPAGVYMVRVVTPTGERNVRVIMVR